MSTRILVLGAGLVGAVVADDLARSPGLQVTVADRSDARLHAARQRTGPALQTLQLDLAAGGEGAITRAAADFDLVVGALPGFLGLEAMRQVIEAGRHYCDISFMPEDFRELDSIARGRGVTVVPDCGVAPGLSNMIAARAVETLDRCDKLDIYVGGLPKHPTPPHNYKAAFSPADVIEEYTRPARLVENGQVVTREALSEVETLDLPRIGALEAFNTDGLRSLMDLGVPNMREKTLRYTGHAEQMRTLRNVGLFREDLVQVRPSASGDPTVSVRPRDLAAALLFPLWTYEEGEADITVMRILAEGLLEGRPVRLTWDLYDEYDPGRRASSMARTTGYVCASVARLIAAGGVADRGVVAPERLGRDATTFDRVLADLAGRSVQVETRRENL